MITFKKYLGERLISEALSNELMYLKRHLNMSDEEKDILRAYDNPWYINDFIRETDYEVDDDVFFTLEDYEKLEWLAIEDKQTLIQYGNYVLDAAGYRYSSEQELYDIAEYKDFVRNQWLVHFSNNAYDIWRDQKFLYGMEYHDYSRLGLSTHFSDDAKQYGGFNFAYRLDEVNAQAFNHRRGTPKYGREAILFKGDGVEIYHYGDEEAQVIFDGKATRPPLIYILNEGGDWVINSIHTGERIYASDDIEQVGYWVDTNYAQYRKHLEPR